MSRHLVEGAMETSAEVFIASNADWQAITVTQQIVRQAGNRAGVTALHDLKTGRRISYAQLASETRHAAKAFALRGLHKGEVVCMYSANVPEYAVAVLAITLAGGVVAPASPTLEADALSRVLAVTKAQWLITARAHLRQALLAASQTAVRLIYSFDSAVGAHHVGELFETVITEDERPTEALLVPQRDEMVWLFDGPQDNGRKYRYAEVATILSQSENQPGQFELNAASLAEAENLWSCLRALQQGQTVLLS